MKVIITGGRSLIDHRLIQQAIGLSRFTFNEIISGMAPGVDTIGYRIGRALEIPVSEFPANWKKFGRSAGPIRNREMVNVADAVLVIWDGKSTQNIINQAIEKDLELCVYYTSEFTKEEIKDAKLKRRSNRK